MAALCLVVCGLARASEASAIVFGDTPSPTSVLLELGLGFAADADSGQMQCLERAFSPHTEGSLIDVGWQLSGQSAFLFPYVPLPLSLLCTETTESESGGGGGGRSQGGGYYGGMIGGGFGLGGGRPSFAPFTLDGSMGLDPGDLEGSFFDPTFFGSPPFNPPQISSFNSAPSGGTDGPGEFVNLLAPPEFPGTGGGAQGLQNTSAPDVRAVPVPEPASVLLTAAGLAAVWRKHRTALARPPSAAPRQAEHRREIGNASLHTEFYQ